MEKLLELKQYHDVEPDDLKEYLDLKIHFKLPEDIWVGINDGYAEFYNSLPAYATFNEDEAFGYMADYLKQEKLIFPYDKLRMIHQFIFDYLTDAGNVIPKE